MKVAAAIIFGLLIIWIIIEAINAPTIDDEDMEM